MAAPIIEHMYYYNGGGWRAIPQYCVSFTYATEVESRVIQLVD